MDIKTESTPDNQSAKIRNYAIAVFCITFTILLLSSLLQMFIFSPFGGDDVHIYSECNNDSAYVFIGAHDNLKGVKCVALDKEFVDNPEIVIEDLSKGDEDVCRFKLSKNTTDPLRFEVWYNGKVRREVCEWQNYYYPVYD